MNVHRIGYKSPQAQAALQAMKKLTKKEVITFNDIIPSKSIVFNDKKVYMQRNAFLEDAHNKKMFEYIDQLMILRDNIAKNIIEHNNKNGSKEYKQAINGYTRGSEILKQNRDINFYETPMVSADTMLDNQYYFVKNNLIHNTSSDAMKNFGR